MCLYGTFYKQIMFVFVICGQTFTHLRVSLCSSCPRTAAVQHRVRDTVRVDRDGQGLRRRVRRANTVLEVLDRRTLPLHPWDNRRRNHNLPVILPVPVCRPVRSTNRPTIKDSPADRHSRPPPTHTLQTQR